MKIITNLYQELTSNEATITDIMRLQQQYHEQRRWSVFEVIKNFELQPLTQQERAALWHVSRAEITTQPAGIRLALDGLKLADSLVASSNPIGAQIAHVTAQWSARYWLEEEAHHEVAFATLMHMADLPPVSEVDVIAHRGAFPADNYVRVCMLQACVEIEACITYGEVANYSTNPLVREIFARITSDESQHRAYFISFAKAFIDAGVYPVKDVLSMAFNWIRPQGGETYGSTRKKQSRRDGFVNWWETVKIDPDDEYTLEDSQIRSEKLQQKKTCSVLKAVKAATGLPVNSIDDLQSEYVKSIRAKVITQ